MMKRRESGNEQENIYRGDQETKLTIIMEASSIDFKITELPHLWTLTFRIGTNICLVWLLRIPKRGKHSTIAHALPRTWPSKEARRYQLRIIAMESTRLVEPRGM